MSANAVVVPIPLLQLLMILLHVEGRCFFKLVLDSHICFEFVVPVFKRCMHSGKFTWLEPTNHSFLKRKGF